ncbi:MAG TPA: GIY-YIG nuclease family protein [Kofleriaceae bacterium]|nr:GIY-YIG nuclease family protein [Kofleriaceae bacterium]
MKRRLDGGPARRPEGESNAPTWFVYVLVSARGRTYVGVALDVERRLRQHNGLVRGGARATRAGRPWRIGQVVGPVASRARAQVLEHALKQRRGQRRLAPFHVDS